jgi:hypothetical protein
MTTEFGKTGDSGQNEDGTNFGQNTEGDQTSGSTENQGIAPDELEALRTRDAAAQAHIPQLESENEDLRNKLLAAEDKLANATTIDEALDKISNNGDSEGLTPDAVTQIVDQVLTQKQTEAASELNWNTVMGKLTETYGDWATADAKVQERAAELDITLTDATAMARNNPKAFLQLFSPTGTTNTDRSSGVRSGGSGQSVGDVSSSEGIRDATYYSKLRKENPNLYWKTETQLQLRRDLYSD